MYNLSKLKAQVDQKLPPQAWNRIVLRVADLLSKKQLDLATLLNPPSDYQVDKTTYILFVKVMKITFKK